MKKKLALLFVLQSCMGAGDMFAKKEQITGNYYLVEGDDGRYDICYHVADAYIGRNPSNSWVMAYAVKDSILVIKSQDDHLNIIFHVLNMKNDNGYNKNDEVYLDTIPEGSFKHSWIGENRYKFIPVK